MKLILELSVAAILLLNYSCKSHYKSITIKLDDFAFNQLPLPNVTEINGKAVKRNFDLKINETHSVKELDIGDIINGIVDTSFQHYPIAIKKGEIVINNSTFQIGLIDENRNGIFNDLNTDKLIFLPKHVDSIYYYPSIYGPVSKIFEQTYVSINEIPYQIFSGQDHVELVQLDTPPDTVHCIFNSTIPNIEVVNEDGYRMKLNDFKEQDKNLIVELWFDGCRGCIKTLPKLKKIDTLNNTIVSLSVIDELSTIKEFKLKHKIAWEMIKSEKAELIKMGNLGNYPSAIVYDKSGELINLSKTYK